MKNSVLILLLICSNCIYAQSEYNYNNEYFHNYYNNLVYNIPPVKDKTVEIKMMKVRNGKTNLFTKQYDSEGKLLSYYNLKDGVSIPVELNTYEVNGKLISQKRYREGKLKYELAYQRDEQGRKTSYEKLKKNGKLKTASSWVYQSADKSCFQSSTLYKKDGETIKKLWNYDYYSACEKKQSTLSNGKGKVLKIWSYDCKHEGEELTRKKNESQICKWEETDGKYLIKVTQSFDEKGRVYKSISTYTIADSVLVNYKKYNAKNELSYETNYVPETKAILNSISYKKGKEKYKTSYTYKGEQLINYASLKKGKKIYSIEYLYNADEMLVGYKAYSKDDELRTNCVLVYQ